MIIILRECAWVGYHIFLVRANHESTLHEYQHMITAPRVCVCGRLVPAEDTPREGYLVRKSPGASQWPFSVGVTADCVYPCRGPSPGVRGGGDGGVVAVRDGGGHHRGPPPPHRPIRGRGIHGTNKPRHLSEAGGGILLASESHQPCQVFIPRSSATFIPDVVNSLHPKRPPNAKYLPDFFPSILPTSWVRS